MKFGMLTCFDSFRFCFKMTDLLCHAILQCFVISHAICDAKLCSVCANVCKTQKDLRYSHFLLY